MFKYHISTEQENPMSLTRETNIFNENVNIFNEKRIIEVITSFVYAKVDFFAAPYLGNYKFNHFSPHHREDSDEHIGETFQHWVKSLTGDDAKHIKMLSYKLKKALLQSGHEGIWRSILIGVPIFEDPNCLYLKRDANNCLRNLLISNRPLLQALIYIFKHYSIIVKWYDKQTDPSLLLRLEARLSEELKYLDEIDTTEKQIEYDKVQKFDEFRFNQIAHLMYSNLDYFTQLNSPNYMPDKVLSKLSTYLKAPLEDKTNTASDKTPAFIKALAGDPNSENVNDDSCLINGDSELLQTLLVKDRKLFSVLYSLCNPETTSIIDDWYSQSSTPTQKSKRAFIRALINKQAYEEAKDEFNLSFDPLFEKLKKSMYALLINLKLHNKHDFNAAHISLMDELTDQTNKTENQLELTNKVHLFFKSDATLLQLRKPEKGFFNALDKKPDEIKIDFMLSQEKKSVEERRKLNRDGNIRLLAAKFNLNTPHKEVPQDSTLSIAREVENLLKQIGVVRNEFEKRTQLLNITEPSTLLLKK